MALAGWLPIATLLATAAAAPPAPVRINGHDAVVDAQGRLVTWMEPAESAFGEFLKRRWEFVLRETPLSPGPPPRSSYPLYFFYDGYKTESPGIEPDEWMNDVGEKVPNWFESAWLYYAFTGDKLPLRAALGLLDYSLEHGRTPDGFAWPRFPYTAANAGDVEFRGFTSAKRFAAHEVQIDHAAEVGLTAWRAYRLTGEERHRAAARDVADVLVRHARAGTKTRSVWPYRVVTDTGRITAEYGANWTGAHALLTALADAGEGDVAAYQQAAELARSFLLRWPMRTGAWTDGHSDTAIDSHTYRSNLSKSNAALYILEHPDFDPEWRTHVPALLGWTEKHFVKRSARGEPGNVLGADIVGEQDVFLHKMGYQTARYAAEHALWFAASGDERSREKAFRSLSWVTYTSDARGRATESPYSKLATWFSDEYGEGPRMVHLALAAVPEWAPPGEDHVLRSRAPLADVSYARGSVRFRTTGPEEVVSLRLSFRPGEVKGGEVTARPLGGGDFAVRLVVRQPGPVEILPPGATK
jgi:hypothetical protein